VVKTHGLAWGKRKGLLGDPLRPSIRDLFADYGEPVLFCQGPARGTMRRLCGRTCPRRLSLHKTLKVISISARTFIGAPSFVPGLNTHCPIASIAF
jgi:hypothetical protein